MMKAHVGFTPEHTPWAKGGRRESTELDRSLMNGWKRQAAGGRDELPTAGGAWVAGTFSA